MSQNVETEMAKLRPAVVLSAMEQTGDGDSQTSPGYDRSEAAKKRWPFVERRRRPRRGPWTADKAQLSAGSQAAVASLVKEPNWQPSTVGCSLEMAPGASAKRGALGRTRPGAVKQATETAVAADKPMPPGPVMAWKRPANA